MYSFQFDKSGTDMLVPFIRDMTFLSTVEELKRAQRTEAISIVRYGRNIFWYCTLSAK